jgi:hypothetical protein
MENIMDKELNAFIGKIFRLNMLQLYNLDGTVHVLDHQRHICIDIKEIPGKTKKEKIINSVLSVLYLCKIWQIHLIKMEYPLPFFLCVQIEKEWLKNGNGVPPYVVLVTNDAVERVKNNPAFEKKKDNIDGVIENAVKNLNNKCTIKFGKESTWRIIIED